MHRSLLPERRWLRAEQLSIFYKSKDTVTDGVDRVLITRVNRANQAEKNTLTSL